MSGAMPTSPAVSELTITSYQETITVKAINGRRQSRQIGGQYWKIRARYNNLTRAEFAPIEAFLMSQRGSYDSFTFTPPILSVPQGTDPGTPLVNGASQTGRSVVTDGWGTGSAQTVLKAGDFIKFTNHSKVYQITADATCDVSGNATLTIEPELQTSPADNEAIVTNPVPFTVFNEGKVIEMSTGVNDVFNFSISFCEAIS